MTISNQPVPKIYTCIGQDEFAFPYRVLNEADVLVLRFDAEGGQTELTLGDYSVTGVGDDAGITVTTEAAYEDGQILVWLKMSDEQLTSYQNNGPFPATSHEAGMDRLTLLSAMHTEQHSRSVHAPLGEALRDLPPAGQRAGRFVGFDSAGNVVVAPAIEVGEVESFDAAQLYWDRNDNLQPRLVIDPGGYGTSPLPGIQNPGGRSRAVLAMQNSVAGGDFSGSQNHFSFLYQDWPDTETDKPRQRRSKGVFGISARTQINAPFWETDPPPRETDELYLDWQYVDGVGGTWGVIPDNPSALYDLYTARIATQKVVDGVPQEDADGNPVMWSWGDTTFSPRYLGQEVSAISGNVVNAAGVVGGKVEGLVFGARQEPDLLDAEGNVVAAAHPCKGVAAQLITVCAVKGPVPDVKTLLDDGDGDNSTSEDDQLVGVVPAMMTLRLNGGTTGGFADPTSFHRSWTACGVSGRAGYVNGVFIAGVHSFDDADATDSYGVKGYGGVWGGRSFWHVNTAAIYAKYDCPGWLTVGHDGIPQSNPDGDGGIARAPIDIVVDTADEVPAQWTANQAVLMFNGSKLLAARQSAIHDALTDSQKITAIIAALRAHGLIDPATS